MIFAHAPVIFPSVLGVQPVFSNRFYVHVALLTLGLLLRVAGDLAGSGSLRQWGRCSMRSRFRSFSSTRSRHCCSGQSPRGDQKKLAGLTWVKADLRARL